MFSGKNKGKNVLSDQELVSKFRYSHDSRYIGELYMRYTHLIFGTCLKYLSNKEDAQDAVMNIFEKVIEDLKKHDVHNFRSWIHTVAKNHCLMELRKRKAHEEKEKKYIKSGVENVETEEFLHLVGELDDEIRLDELNKAIGSLKQEQKICVELFYLKKKSYSEVAEITGFSAQKVKSYIQNGKRNLKIYLNNTDE